MCVIHTPILIPAQKALLFSAQMRFLLKNSIIQSAPMRTKIPKDRHTVHKTPQQFIPFLRMKNKSLCHSLP